MPTIIKKFNWNQTETHIKIEIPLKGVQQSKLDSLISSRYVKVSYEKNLFDVILLSCIDVKESKCIIRPEGIILELRKCEQIHWDCLEPSFSKEERFKLKNQLLEDFYKKIQHENEEKSNQRAELKRMAVRKQIETDTSVRKRIDNIKLEEKTLALGDTKEWVDGMIPKSLSKQTKSRAASKIFISKNPNIEISDNIVPNVLPRQLKTVQVNFTSREFPTPCRESKLEEENEWLSKQAAARRNCGFVSEDIRPEERSPQFLIAKGDELFRNNNYLGAISAYSYGIQISPEFVDLYISRSKAHYEIGENMFYFTQAITRNFVRFACL